VFPEEDEGAAKSSEHEAYAERLAVHKGFKGRVVGVAVDGGFVVEDEDEEPDVDDEEYAL